VAIAMIVLAYLLVFPAFAVLRVREPRLERPCRVPGGTAAAVAVSTLTTAWSLLAAVCLLWPGFGTADPDEALPAGFAGDRLGFELLVISPVAIVVATACLFFAIGRHEERAAETPDPGDGRHARAGVGRAAELAMGRCLGSLLVGRREPPN